MVNSSSECAHTMLAVTSNYSGDSTGRRKLQTRRTNRLTSWTWKKKRFVDDDIFSRPISKIDRYIELWSPITESPISEFF